MFHLFDNFVIEFSFVFFFQQLNRSQQYSSPPNTPACLSPNNASSTTTNSIFNKLVFATDFIIDDQQAAQCNADDLFAHLMQLIRRLNQLKIAKEEYLLMKAIILTNAGKMFFFQCFLLFC